MERKGLILAFVLSQMNPAHTHEIHFNIMLSGTLTYDC